MYPKYPAELKGSSGGRLPKSNESDIITFGLTTQNGDQLAYDISGCKEYILDYTYYSVIGTRATPYGTQAKAVCLDEVRMVIGNWSKYVDQSVDFLNQIESALNIPHSIPFVVPNDEKTYVFRGSKRWLIAPPMLSFYGLIIRASAKHTIGETYENTFKKLIQPGNCGASGYEHTLWTGSMPAIKTLLKYGDQVVFGQDMKRNWARHKGYGVHGWGVQGWGSGHLKVAFPDFYYLFPESKKS